MAADDVAGAELLVSDEPFDTLTAGPGTDCRSFGLARV